MTELRTNQTMISVCESVAKLLVNNSYPLTEDEKECAIRVLNASLFSDICEERKANQLCSNLKCAFDCVIQPKPASLLRKMKGEAKTTQSFCENPLCPVEFEKTKNLVEDRESLVIENHVLLDQAAQCLTNFAEKLDDTDFV